MLPKWEDRFSIHNEKIDMQHKKLFQLAYKAYNLELIGTNRSEIKLILGEFFEYMKTHFADEEAYMEKLEYPEIIKHKRLHKIIIEELSKTIRTVKNVHDMREKLKIIAHDWLLEHILHDDMMIEDYRVRAAVTMNDEQERVFGEHQEAHLYECGCKGKIHKVPPTVHETISKKEKTFRCKVCKEAIKPIEI